MKNLYKLVTTCLLLGAGNLTAQNYIPLTLDSSYYHAWGSPSLTSWAAFSYDAEDSLVQFRQEGFRINYSYAQDTTFLLTEFPENNDWVIKSRGKVVYSDKKQVYKLTENRNNGVWENSARHFWFYNTHNQDSVYIIQHWNDGIWKNYYQKELSYSANNDPLEEAEYYADINGNLKYNRGNLWKYDNAHHRIQEIGIATGINGSYYTGRVNWTYGNDDLPDVVFRCEYFTFPDTICKNIARYVYTYSGDSTVQHDFSWMDNQWKYIGDKVSFDGPGIYGNKPDSIIYYLNWPDSATYTPIEKEFLRYEETGNGKVYFRDEKFRYNPQTIQWNPVWITEEWYHLKPSVKTHETVDNQTDIAAYPNPCRPGNIVHIKNFTDSDQVSEFLIFNQEGRLIKSIRPMPDGTFAVPEKAGVYAVLIRNKSGISGLFRLVVVE